MAKKYMLNAKTLVASTSTVKEELNTKSIVVAVCICIVGLLILFLSSWIEDKSSSSYMGGFTLSILLFAIGFYRLLNKRKQLVYLPTQSVILSGSLYFNNQQMGKLKSVLSENPNTDYSQFEFTKSGNSRLDYVVSYDEKFVGVQLYEFVPYNFEPVTEIICYHQEKAADLARFLLTNHGKI